MGSERVRQRAQKLDSKQPDGKASTSKAAESRARGRVKPSVFSQVLRLTLFISWFLLCCAATFATQILGCWLYFVNKNYYHAYMALTKQSFGILCVTGTQWFSPTTIRVSGDKSVEGQLKLTKDGRLETNFPERLLIIANHQLYPEWVYLWWVAYTSRMHGHIFIILKESLKYIPILGQGMMFYGFIFMARDWLKDEPRMAHRLKKLTERHDGPMSGSQSLDPMWLLIFPEGTNLSANTRKNVSAKWAERSGKPDFKHQLLPRSKGSRFTLSQLRGTIEWVYDCTLAYEGIPEGGYAQDYYTLRSTYLEGRPPRVNMYWRRFPVSSIPLGDPGAFDEWLMQVWREKEKLLDYFAEHNKFPGSEAAVTGGASANGSTIKAAKEDGYIETEVRLAHWIEVGQIFVVVASIALIANVIVKAFNFVTNVAFA